ncbi:DNA or RNA helicase of superfamily II [Acidipropionibacterium acidipropionici ATCC 4875]|uniref:DNA 3'-5' helicase n=1 Tax=Acidipropionibacterium acidipropionici (strain ATCC 4875 / DSM 20272 / JCM 6432 / NBRC 12425 / NCIMB 8070 / 4) TaxID=1171373 RepID=K7SHL0_ACIA4|nr:DNA repair helicase XPB [Acidipropionibacterium acidipropionici]AFV88750.1 DNA or RNA helicase of superfamily II [Acidipropionibacterium acidipropionici ATCC 4875]
MPQTPGPLIVQSDRTLLLEVDHPLADECRHAIAPFAELERAPEHIHTYRLTPLGLWNAMAAGHDAEQVVDVLMRYSRYPVASSLLVDVTETMGRYGRLRIEKHPTQGLVLVSTDKAVLTEVLRSKSVRGLVGDQIDEETAVVHPSQRGTLKQALLKLGWPAEDLAGYVDGEHHDIALREEGWELRPYQRVAAESFWDGGSGVVVLPCGAGKTLVGATAMSLAQCTTLILVTNTVSARQWKDELVRRTSLTADEIGEYSGSRKEVRPVTIATYQVITTKRHGVHPHLELFEARDWGLVIYDEVHLLPAPVFRMTADLQARRRLGLTATLVREDGHEEDVFTLIGPKRYDAPWKEIEAQGWIAPADCVEVRVNPTEDERMACALAEPDVRYRMASTLASKNAVVRDLVERHRGQPTLVIGQYVDQLEELADELGCEIITGATTSLRRQKIYQQFRDGEINLLVVSKVANFSIDLPSAEVAIQVSGSFGSRQEEAQRLGRLLRPKHGLVARFYAVVSRDTVDADFAAHRQRFLAEQGYSYRIVDGGELDRINEA